MFYRLFRRSKKASPKPRKRAQQKIFVTTEQGYNPYDTLPGIPRERFGMRRRDDGKWHF
ncbi:MAG: hypothetical protein KJO35_09520 [Gammaproteobacteria bacterium]|nr:hypothetical protein [Gammaproteobacteria bacterium]